jgi:hypothetical protein
VLFRG